jgi:tetratricopeptide (TPR) repeat protein
METFIRASAQHIDFVKVKAMEHHLDDVMEIIDTSYLKRKLIEVEKSNTIDPCEINKARLGIIYHETALNLSFFSKTEYKGYAQKSYALLSELFNSADTTQELMPFISAFRASALSLISAETNNLKLLSEAFKEFNDAVEKYGNVSYCPEYMRGSVAENLPWFLFSKAKHAKHDFQSIIEKQQQNADYANWKIMSFTYWAWAKKHQSIKFRKQAIDYLDKAIALDPDYQAGREKAERLKEKLNQI